MHGNEFGNINNDRSSKVLDDRKEASGYDHPDILLPANLFSGGNHDTFGNKTKVMHDDLPVKDLPYQSMFDHITKQGKGSKKFRSRHILSLNNPEVTKIRNSTQLKSEKVKQQQSLKSEPNNRTKMSRLNTESDLNAIMKIIEGRRIKNNNGSKFITDKELNKVIDNYYLQNPQLLTFNSSMNYKKTNTVILGKNSTINPPATSITNSKVLNRTHPDSNSYQTHNLPELQFSHDANRVSITQRPPDKEYRNFHPKGPYNRSSTINIYINSLFTIPGVPKGMNELVLHIPRDKIAQLFNENNGTSDINIDLGNITPLMNNTQPPLLSREKYSKDGTYSVKRDSVTYQQPPTTQPSIQMEENEDLDLITGLATPYTLTPKNVPKYETYAVKRDGITYQPPTTTQRSIQTGENKDQTMITELATPYTLEPNSVPKDKTYSVKRDGITYAQPPTTQPSIPIQQKRDQGLMTGLATPYTLSPNDLPISNKTTIPSETMNKLKYLLGIRSANQSQSLASLQGVNKTSYSSAPSIFLTPKPLHPTMPSSYSYSVDPQYDNINLYSIALNGQKRNISQSAIVIFNKKYDQQKNTLDHMNGTRTLKPSNSLTPPVVNESKPMPLQKLTAEVESLHNKINVAFNVHKKEILKSSISILRKQNDRHKEALQEMNKILSDANVGNVNKIRKKKKSNVDNISNEVAAFLTTDMPEFMNHFLQQSQRFNNMKDKLSQKEGAELVSVIEDTNTTFPTAARLSNVKRRFLGQKARFDALKDKSNSITQNTSSSFPLAQMVKLHPIKSRSEKENILVTNVSRLEEQLIDQQVFLDAMMRRRNITTETMSNNLNNVPQIKSQDAISPISRGGALSELMFSQGIYD